MARTGMATLISELRLMTEVSASDYSIVGSGGTTTYFSDDQLQSELDKTRRDYHMMAVEPQAQTVGGSAAYYDYAIPTGHWFEEATGGTSVWSLRDSTGTLMGTANYSVNYQAGVISFPTNTNGTAYYLDYRTFDLNQAASQVWRFKAAHAANRVDWRSDNMQRSASQERSACLEMASYFNRLGGGARSVQVVRSDLV